MSAVEDVGPIGIVQAERRAMHALVLAFLSRGMVGVLVVAVAWATTAVRSAAGDAGLDARPVLVAARPDVAPVGTSVGAMLEDVRLRVVREGATLIDLEVTRGGGASASVRLTIDLARSDAATVDRLVAGLERGELTEPTPRSVDPVPTGLRVGIDASVELASAAPSLPEREGRAAVIALADAAERAGVELRGVDVPERPRDPVRLSATGDLSALVRLVDIVEQEHSAPLRFRRVSMQRSTSGAYDVALSFGLREDVVRTVEVPS